jgi:hypothetical protein
LIKQGYGRIRAKGGNIEWSWIEIGHSLEMRHSWKYVCLGAVWYTYINSLARILWFLSRVGYVPCHGCSVHQYFCQTEIRQMEGGEEYSRLVWIPFHSVFYRFATRSVAEE